MGREDDIIQRSPVLQAARFDADIEAFPVLAPITTRQILYLLIFQGLGSFLINFGANFLVAWLIFRNYQDNRVTYLDNLTCIFSDTLVTGLIIVAAGALIGYPLARKDVKSAAYGITPISHAYLDHWIFRLVPCGSSLVHWVGRAIILTLIFLIVWSIPTVLIILAIVGRHGTAKVLWGYIVYKGVWGGVTGLLSGIYIGFIAIAQ